MSTILILGIDHLQYQLIHARIIIDSREEEGYFAEEGINLDLVTGFGADKVMTAVLSGEADIGFMGPETTVYTANEGSRDQVINSAQLTRRAGNFLVAREPDGNFEWSKLVSKDVLGGRAGG